MTGADDAAPAWPSVSEVCNKIANDGDLTIPRLRRATTAAPGVDRSVSTIGTIDYVCIADIPMRRVDWLWPRRIACGKVTLIAGHPGLGKSQITTSLAAVVTTGGRWPVDRTAAPRGSVITLSAEDNPEDTIGPRLVAAGADRERVYVARAIHDVTTDGTDRRRHIDLGRDIDAVDAMAHAIGSVTLIIIDPVTAYLGGIDSHRTSDVRGVMAPLADLAARHRAAVVCVSHLRKQGGAEAMRPRPSCTAVALL